MKILSILALITILFITIVSAAVKPVVHKQFILAPQDFKINSLGERPIDLQSVQMFKIGEAPVKVVSADTPIVQVQAEAPIIPSDIKIIPSDFIQQVPPRGSNVERQPQEANNSDKALEGIAKMLDTTLAEDSSKPKQEKAQSQEKPSGSGCSLCDALFDPKVRAEMIAWNKWRSDIQNAIMDASEIDANYGAIFLFSFSVDKNRHISNIKVTSRNGGSEADKRAVRRAILSLEGSALLEFPKGSNRKNVSFTGAFLISDYSYYSNPADFHDFEYVQSAY